MTDKTENKSEVLAAADAIEVPAVVDSENSGIVIFSHAYTFEGKVYNELDLSGVAELTGGEICSIEQKFERMGHISPLKELNTFYALLIASHVTKLPIEFFKNLKSKDIVKIRNIVQNSFF